MEQIRRDIRNFKANSKVDKIIVLWTANTERFCDVCIGLNDTTENLLKSKKDNAEEISPSTMFAVASILEGVIQKLLIIYNFGQVYCLVHSGIISFPSVCY